ncbi:hypothetical protein [Clostridium luticellarii]|uniref:Uncharacterized protein n=1 Tax=Clostridium luticellarii TaxID=1691940 RepID=A0A2T0BQ76_9CLOT|nr:hypothetical protein [Clostridium luticellarii]PRR86016.1 hypothetical protein CLLU_10440 [Clostridium luticellarii]
MSFIDPNSIDLNSIIKLASAFKELTAFANNIKNFFQKNFSEKDIKELLDKIESNDELKLQLYYITDNVNKELTVKKIKLWVNACKNLSNNIYTNEVFLKTLNNMSYLEYIVLQSYSDNPQPIDIQLKSSTLIAKNKLVAMGLLINENYIKKSKWEELNSEKEVETEYILSEFGTKMLEFLSDYKK